MSTRQASANQSCPWVIVGRLREVYIKIKSIYKPQDYSKNLSKKQESLYKPESLYE